MSPDVDPKGMLVTPLPRTEIVGFTIAGPAPLGEVHVQWRTGVSVLYGANGSGKTTILRGIERSLSGTTGIHDAPTESAAAYVHVRLVDWDIPLVGVEKANINLSEAAEIGTGRTYNTGDELTSSIIANLKQDISLAPTWWEASRREHGARLVQQIRSLEDGDVGPTPLELLEVMTGPGDREPYLTFRAAGTSDGEDANHEYSVFLGHPRGDGERHEQREIHLRYELLRDRVEEFIRTVLEEERTEALIQDAARTVLAEIEADGIPMGGVDLDYAALCLQYLIDPHADVPGSSDFWIDFDGYGGPPDQPPLLFFPLLAEAALAPTWVPMVEATPTLKGEFFGLPEAISSSESAYDDLRRRWVRVYTSIAEQRNAMPEELAGWFQDNLTDAEERANRIGQLLFPELPRLSWRPGTAAEWIDGRPFAWEAIDSLTGAAIPIDQLSEAQQRWAGLVLALNAGARDILLIDEPELGLHQRAAARTARRLAAFAVEEDIPVIVASHSAGFLALDAAHLLHVLRRPGDGKTAVKPVDRANLVKKADALDLDVVDLLQLVRTWVVVEGEHDRALIDELIGQELRAAGAELVTMRGAKNLVTLADAEVLFKYTDASVVLVLDAIDDAEAIQAMWMKATAAVRDGRVSEALGAVTAYRQSHRDPGYEERQLLAFAQQAIGITDPSRVRLFGFQAKDIIEYVPPSEFGLDEEWPDLRSEYDGYTLKKGDFKNWLSLRKGARINVDSIRAAASEVRHEDMGEFAALLNMAVD